MPNAVYKGCKIPSTFLEEELVRREFLIVRENKATADDFLNDQANGIKRVKLNRKSITLPQLRAVGCLWLRFWGLTVVIIFAII